MLDVGSIPTSSTKSTLQVREQRRNVFVDLATWNDSLLSRYSVFLMGETWFRQREIVETATRECETRTTGETRLKKQKM